MKRKAFIISEIKEKSKHLSTMEGERDRYTHECKIAIQNRLHKLKQELIEVFVEEAEQLFNDVMEDYDENNI